MNAWLTCGKFPESWQICRHYLHELTVEVVTGMISILKVKIS